MKVDEEPIEFLMMERATLVGGDPRGGDPRGGGPREFDSTRERRGERRRTPHEVGRVVRRMGVTFPADGWAEAVRALARRWGVRTGDVLVLAVARLMADVEEGVVEEPDGRAGFQDRAGEGMELPWEPGGQ